MQLKLDLSTPTTHPKSAMPAAVYEACSYGSGFTSILPATMAGYHGGQHRLVVSGNHDDLNAWLDLFVERFPLTKPEIIAIKKAIRLAVVYGNHDVIRLADLTRQHPHEGTLVSRPWFWTYDNR